MPYLIAGILETIWDDIIASSDGPVTDPVPEMIHVWETYNNWCHLVTRTEISTQDLEVIDKAGRSLMRLIHEVFPYKGGPDRKEHAWNIMKAHDTVYHFVASIILWGRIQVNCM